MTATILIIDDSKVVLDVTRMWLEKAGFRVFTHDRATGCVSLILQLKPDLVLLDVNMPTLTGDVIAKMFDKTASSAGTIVVLHSTLSDEELQRRVAISGAHGFLRKTEKRYEFVRHIRGWLGRGEESAGSDSGRWAADSPGTSQSRISVSRAQTAVAPGGSGVSSAQRRTSGVTVLFVDWDMATLADYRDAAQDAGFIAAFALSARQALGKIVSDTPPALVVADVGLPMPGIDHLYREARRHDRKYERRFMVAVTAQSRVLVPKDFPGPVLLKPISGATLTRAIQQTLADRAFTA